MFTQCPKCETIFRLTAEALRSAGGQVRCGRCKEVFDGLARLAEDPSGFKQSESPLELEARADAILGAADTTEERETQAAVPAEVDADDDAVDGTAAVEIARLAIMPAGDRDQGGAADDDRALEFTLPPGELDRIFVEANAAPRSAEAAEIIDSAVAAAALPAFDGGGIGADGRDASAADSTVANERQGDPRRILRWGIAAGLLALLLAAQIVHHNRARLAGQAPFGAALRALYARLGAPLVAPAYLAGYQLRQWGVTGDPAANGTLKVRASIMNTTSQLQPYPLLRVTLADRFGAHIGTREFEPAEYMGKPTAHMLTPGERVDATLAILDPGKNAEGFEIDVCLRGQNGKVTCAGEAPEAGR